MVISIGFTSSYKQLVNENDLIENSFFFVVTSRCGKYVVILCDYAVYLYSSTPYLSLLNVLRRTKEYPAHAYKAYWSYDSKNLFVNTTQKDLVIMYSFEYTESESNPDAYSQPILGVRSTYIDKKLIPEEVIYVGKQQIARVDSNIVKSMSTITSQPQKLGEVKNKSMFFDEPIDVSKEMFLFELQNLDSVEIQFKHVLIFPLNISSIVLSYNHILYSCESTSKILSTHISDLSQIDGLIEMRQFVLNNDTGQIMAPATEATFLQEHLRRLNSSSRGINKLKDVCSYLSQSSSKSPSQPVDSSSEFNHGLSEPCIYKSKQVPSKNGFNKYSPSKAEFKKKRLSKSTYCLSVLVSPTQETDQKWETIIPLNRDDVGIKQLELSDFLGLIGVVLNNGFSAILAWSSPYNSICNETSWLYNKTIGYRPTQEFVVAIALNHPKKVVALLTNMNTVQLWKVQKIKTPYVTVKLNFLTSNLIWSLDGETIAVQLEYDVEVYDYRGTHHVLVSIVFLLGQLVLPSKNHKSSRVSSVAWISMDLQLALLQEDTSILAIPFYKESCVTAGTCATVGLPFGYQPSKVYIGAEHLLIVNPNTWDGKSYGFIKISLPTNSAFLKLNWPIRVASTNFRNDSILIAGRYGVALYSLRNETWQVTGVQEKFHTHSLPHCWYTNSVCCLTYRVSNGSYDLDQYESMKYQKLLCTSFLNVKSCSQVNEEKVKYELIFIDVNRSFCVYESITDCLNLLHRPIHMFTYHSAETLQYPPPFMKSPTIQHTLQKLQLIDTCRPCGSAVDTREKPFLPSKYAPNGFCENPILAIYDSNYILCTYRLNPPRKNPFEPGKSINTRMHNFYWLIVPLWKINLSFWIEHPISIQFAGNQYHMIAHHGNQKISFVRIKFKKENQTKFSLSHNIEPYNLPGYRSKPLYIKKWVSPNDLSELINLKCSEKYVSDSAVSIWVGSQYQYRSFYPLENFDKHLYMKGYYIWYETVNRILTLISVCFNTKTYVYTHTKYGAALGFYINSNNIFPNNPTRLGVCQKLRFQPYIFAHNLILKLLNEKKLVSSFLNELNGSIYSLEVYDNLIYTVLSDAFPDFLKHLETIHTTTISDDCDIPKEYKTPHSKHFKYIQLLYDIVKFKVADKNEGTHYSEAPFDSHPNQTCTDERKGNHKEEQHREFEKKVKLEQEGKLEGNLEEKVDIKIEREQHDGKRDLKKPNNEDGNKDENLEKKKENLERKKEHYLQVIEEGELEGIQGDNLEKKMEEIVQAKKEENLIKKQEEKLQIDHQEAKNTDEKEALENLHQLIGQNEFDLTLKETYCIPNSSELNYEDLDNRNICSDVICRRVYQLIHTMISTSTSCHTLKIVLDILKSKLHDDYNTLLIITLRKFEPLMSPHLLLSFSILPYEKLYMNCLKKNQLGSASLYLMILQNIVGAVAVREIYVPALVGMCFENNCFDLLKQVLTFFFKIYKISNPSEKNKLQLLASPNHVDLQFVDDDLIPKEGASQVYDCLKDKLSNVLLQCIIEFKWIKLLFIQQYFRLYLHNWLLPCVENLKNELEAYRKSVSLFHELVLSFRIQFATSTIQKLELPTINNFWSENDSIPKAISRNPLPHYTKNKPTLQKYSAKDDIHVGYTDKTKMSAQKNKSLMENTFWYKSLLDAIEVDRKAKPDMDSISIKKLGTKLNYLVCLFFYLDIPIIPAAAAIATRNIFLLKAVYYKESNLIQFISQYLRNNF